MNAIRFAGLLLLTLLLPLAAADPVGVRQLQARLDLLLPRIASAESQLSDALTRAQIAFDPALTRSFAATREAAREVERLAGEATTITRHEPALRAAVGDLERRIAWSYDVIHLLYARESEAVPWRDHPAPPELVGYGVFIDGQVRARLAALTTGPREAVPPVVPDHRRQSRRHELLLEVLAPLQTAPWVWPRVAADAPVLARLRALTGTLALRLERALQDDALGDAAVEPSEQERELLRFLTQQGQFEQECAERITTCPAQVGEVASQVVRLIAAGGITSIDELVAHHRLPLAQAREGKARLAEIQRRCRRQHQLRLLAKRWLQGEVEVAALPETLAAQMAELPSALRVSAQGRQEILAPLRQAAMDALAQALATNDQFAVATGLGECMAVQRAGQRLQEEWDWTLRLERHRQALIAQKVDLALSVSYQRLQNALDGFLAQRHFLDDAEDAERRNQGARFAAEEAKVAARQAREEFVRQLQQVEFPDAGPSPTPEADPGF